MKVYVKWHGKNNHIQFFMQQFVESCVKNGFKLKKDYFLHDKLGIKSKIMQYSESIYVIIQKFFPFLICRSKAVLISAAGDTMFRDAFPYYYNSEIIPMLWDVWPSRWNGIYYALRLFKCKIVFCTVREFAEQLSKDFGIKTYWIPEGIDITKYQKGAELATREIDILELGRQKKEYHEVLEKMNNKNMLSGYYRSIFYPNGSFKLAFPTAEELIRKLPVIKIVISFPHIDTNP